MDAGELEDENSSAEQDLEEELISQEAVEEEILPLSSASESDSYELQNESVEMPGVVVITQGANGPADPPTKQVFLEPVTQDGQTFVLTLNSHEALQTTQVHFDSAKLQGNISHLTTENVGEQSDFNQAWFTSREDKSNLHNKGHLWKQGMWSKEEADLLQTNIALYCKGHGVVDPAEIIFEMTKDERKDFYRNVAKGLNRPLFSVYRRVIRMYDNKNHVGKYTPEEIERLRELRTKHGNDWQAIGCALGRSASSIKDRCRLMKDNCNTGKWLANEERRLSDAVYQLSRTMPGETVTSGISWAAVAEMVGTRSEKQCRTKWLNYLNWKQTGGTEWTREDDINLICKVYNMNINDENGVDWAELARGWPSVRSPQWLRGKWWNLKRHVPDAHLLSFRMVCEYLYNNHTQVVRVKVNGEEGATQTILETATPLTIPQVSVVQAPSIVTTVPLHVKTDAPQLTPSIAQSGEEVCTISAPMGATFQTYEVVPTGMHLNAATNATPFLIAAPQTTIPFTTCAPTTTGQIIIQALPAETLRANENVTVHMNMPSQIIISTTSAIGPTGIATPIHIARPIMQTSGHQLLATQAGTLLTTATATDLLAAENRSKVQELPTDMNEQNMETEDREEQIAQESGSSHLILADPMLSSNDPTEFIGHASDQECDKMNGDT